MSVAAPPLLLSSPCPSRLVTHGRPHDSPADLLLGAGGHASPSSPTLHLRVGPRQRRCARSPLRPCTRRATRSHAAAAHRARRAASRPRGRRAATSTVANTVPWIAGYGLLAISTQPRRATRRARVLRLRDRRRVDRVQHASRRRARWPRAACSARDSTSASPMASSPRSASACGTTSRPTRPAGGGYGAARARAALPRRRWMEHARARHDEDGRLVSSSASEAPPSLARRPPQAARRRFGRAKGQALASI